MPAAVDRAHPRPIHPIYAVLLAGTVPLFLGALLSDIAYASSFEVQWKNFASWLIVGGLVFGGLALLWALIELIRGDRWGRRPSVSSLLLLATWLLGFVNALIHAKDAWASMPAALILSVIIAMLAIVAAGFGFSTLTRRG